MKRINSKQIDANGRFANFFGGASNGRGDFPFVDQYRGQLTPNPRELIRAFTGTVYSCANLTATYMGQTPLRLYKKGGSATTKSQSRYHRPLFNTQIKNLHCKGYHPTAQTKLSNSLHYMVEEVTDNSFLDLLKEPNPLMDWQQLFEISCLYMEIAGIAYWWMGDEGRIWLLQPQYMQPDLDPATGFPIGFFYGAPSSPGSNYYPADQVVPFSLPNLNDLYAYGYSWVRAVFEDVNINQKFDSLLQNMLDNQARPDFIITVKDGLNPDEHIRWRQKITSELSQRKAGNFAIVDEDATVTPMSFTPKDLSSLEIAKRADLKICNASGVPTAMLNTEQVNRANMQAAMQWFANTTLGPRLRRFESKINRFVLPMFLDPYDYFVAFDDPSPEQRELLLAETTGYVAGSIITPNEAREEIGRGPTEGGDRLIGSNLQGVQSAEPGVSNGTATEGTQAPASTGKENLAEIMELISQRNAGELTDETLAMMLSTIIGMDAAQADKLVATLPAMVEDHTEDAPEDNETAIQPGEQAPFKRLILPAEFKGHSNRKIKLPPVPDGKALEPILKKHFKKWEHQTLNAIHKTANKPANKALPERFVPVREWSDSLAHDIKPVIELYYENAGNEMIARVGASPDVNEVFNQRVAHYAQNKALHLSEQTMATTEKYINEALHQTRQAIHDGLTEGESIDELKKRIGQVFEDAEDYRTERIARTEASEAHHEGLRAAAIDSDVVKEFEWLTASECCDLCEAKNGERIPLDGDLPPSIHPNCVCTALAILNSMDN